MGQPAKVFYLLTAAPVHVPKETDLKVVTTIPFGNAHVKSIDQQPTEAMQLVGDQDKQTTETTGIEGSSEQQSSLPSPSSSCPSDAVLDLCEHPNVPSTTADGEKPNVALVDEHETKEQKPESE